MRRPSEARLLRAFHQVLRLRNVLVGVGTAGAALATTAAAGCGGSTIPDGPGGGGGGPNPELTSLCDPRPAGFLKGLRPDTPIDGAIGRKESAFLPAPTAAGAERDPYEIADQWKGTSSETVGTPCATATDPAACNAKIAGYRLLPPTRDECVTSFPGGDNAGCAVSYVLYTRGDEIGVARTDEELMGLVGKVDSIDEALWLATRTGGQLYCREPATNGVPNSQYRTTNDGGYDLVLIDAPNCGKTTFELLVHVDPAGNVTVVQKTDLGVEPDCAVAGRRPEGLRVAEGSTAEIGEHFAAMATLEAASVTAFRRLHRQLAAHGAPKDLLDRIRKAARDEIRHARKTTALARKHGASPRPAEIAPDGALPSLFAIALENAREGCVRETYGALLAHLQRARATDLDVRSVMTEIADEETEHAALSWDIAAWAETRLDDSERAAVAAERRSAIAQLARELAAPVDARTQQLAGLPAPPEALGMLATLAPSLV